MNNKSVIENPERLKALLREKSAYNKYMSNHSIWDRTFEDVARERRIGILRARFEGYEIGLFSSLMERVTAKEITLDKAAKIAGMPTEAFIKKYQEVINENSLTETDNNNSKSENYKPLSDSEFKPIIMRHMERGHSIPAIAGYTSRTIDKIEEITGLKSEVSQLEYDIINDLLEFRYDVKKEVLIAIITNLIYEGILSVSEAADRMKMNLEDFLNDSGLNDKCSFDGKLMFKTNMDLIIDKCMNSLVENLNITDTELFCYILNNEVFNYYEWLIDYLKKTLDCFEKALHEGDVCSE